MWLVARSLPASPRSLRLWVDGFKGIGGEQINRVIVRRIQKSDRC
jgi:hypothetical protein